MKERIRDCERSLKKSWNTSFANLEICRRVDLGTSRRIIDDDDNQIDPLVSDNEVCIYNDGDDSYNFYAETQARSSKNAEGCLPSKYNISKGGIESPSQGRKETVKSSTKNVKYRPVFTYKTIVCAYNA